MTEKSWCAVMMPESGFSLPKSTHRVNLGMLQSRSQSFTAKKRKYKIVLDAETEDPILHAVLKSLHSS